jgi:zinc transporter 1/2/3
LTKLVSKNGAIAIASEAILDALAAGILLYNGFVNLFAPHFSSLTYHNSSNLIKALDIGFVWLGCTIMIVIGIWT